MFWSRERAYAKFLRWGGFWNLKADQFSLELSSEYKMRMAGPVLADLRILEFVLK